MLFKEPTLANEPNSEISRDVNAKLTTCLAYEGEPAKTTLG